MSFSNVKLALINAYIGGNFFDEAHTAYQNKKFTPPTGEPWAQVTFVPAQPTVATLGLGGRDRITGFLQIDLNYLTDTGEQAADAMFNRLRNLFTVGSRFVYGGDEVVIRSCGCSQGRIVNNYYKVSVTVYFYSDIQR